jgi:hypothetical protein
MIVIRSLALGLPEWPAPAELLRPKDLFQGPAAQLDEPESSL